MSSGRLIVVVGATGNQGGSCVDALLQQAVYHVRGLTRNAGSAQAASLLARNVRTVEGDLNDQCSLHKAFQGAYGVFAVTDFYKGAGTNAETEIQQGKNVVDAAEKAGVKHLVWSGLEDPRAVIKGGLPEVKPGRVVPHFESKAEVTEYLRKSGVPFTILEPGIFYENALRFPYKKQQDGSVMFSLNAGSKAHPQCAVADIGATAAVAFGDDQYVGATLPVVGEYISYATVAQNLSKVTGKTVKFVELTREQVAAFPFPGAAELANMFAYYSNFTEFADRRPYERVILKGNTFEKWAHKFADDLKLAVGKAE